MAAFVHTDDFRNLNIGCGFDEGCPSENDTFFLFYGEKITWRNIIFLSNFTQFSNYCHDF